ncbi:MAG: PAS domain S-box protein [Gammaproteobacteria bacterium]|nr:PAS domain S-box protein [Gammaproteobacteria bacterium]MDH5802369.1 PAS domain S-box protein [Gammaproteobacteria bacterium]
MESNELTRSFLEQTLTCHLFLDEQLYFLHANPAFLEVCKVSTTELQKNLSAHLPAPVLEIIQHSLSSKFPSRSYAELLSFGENSDTKAQYYDIATDLLFDDNGAVAGIVCSLCDVTDKVLADKKLLQESETRYEEVAASVPGAVFQLLVTPDGKLEVPFMSEGFARITGISSQDVVANPAVAFGAVHPDDVGTLRERIFSSAEQLQDHTAEFRLYTKSGELKWFQTRTHPHLLDDGSVLKHGFILDITDQKFSEQQLLSYRDDLESSIAERTAQVKEQAAIINQINEAVIATDLEGFITSWNWGAQRIFNYTPDHMIGRSILSIYPASQHLSIYSELLEPLHTEGTHKMERTLVRRDKTEFHASISLASLKSDTKTVKGIIAVIADQTEQRRTQNALKKHQAEAIALLNAVPDKIFQLNRDGEIKAAQVGQAATDAYRNINELFPVEISAKIKTYVMQSLDARETITFEYTDRENHTEYEARVAAISKNEAMMLVRNITQRKQAEQMKEANGQYFQSLDKISRILSGTSDLSTTLFLAMEELLNIFDVERAWLLYPLDTEAESFQIPVEATHPDYPGVYVQQVSIPMTDAIRAIGRQILSSDKPVVHDFSNLEGSAAVAGIVPVKSQISIAIYPRDGKPWMLGLHQCRKNRNWSSDEQRLFHDIAQRVSDTLSSKILLQRLEHELGWRIKTERELVEAKNIAEKANRAKSDFLSSMSHELRTPMNAILGFAQILAVEDLSDEHLDLVNEINVAGRHLMALINDILDLERIEAGTITIHKENTSLRHVIEECEHLIQPMAQAKNIQFQLTPDSKINTSVFTDRVRLKQVLLNLLSNAVKYNKPNGKVSLSCKKSKKNLAITVADTGVGISKEKQEILFTAFQRFGAERTNIEGTGIGLVITKSLVDLMGGTISVKSTPDVGTSFCVKLPIEEPVEQTLKT